MNIFVRLPQILDRKLASASVSVIKIYQKTLSPDHGAVKNVHPHTGCKFYPTCSKYGVQAFEKYGFLVGGLKTIWRILKCHPWSQGGIDKP